MHYTGAPLQTHVAVAKAGVDALSANVALEFGPRGITSNVIAPGGISGTEGLERLARKEDIQGSVKRIPMGRFGTVREIADATVYLFSEAAGYVTGTVMVGESLRLPYVVGYCFRFLPVFDCRTGSSSCVTFFLRNSFLPIFCCLCFLFPGVCFLLDVLGIVHHNRTYQCNLDIVTDKFCQSMVRHGVRSPQAQAQASSIPISY